MCLFDFFGTKKFHDAYPDPQTELEKYRDYFRNKIWEPQIGGGTYTTWPSVVVDISQTPDYIHRKVDYEDDWLANNHPDVYDGTDCAIVMDYWGDGGSSGAAAMGSSAGSSNGKTATVDLGYFNLPSYYDGDIKDHHKIVGHEVGHVFGAEHTDAIVKDNGDSTLLLTTDSKASCGNSGSPEWVMHKYASCALGSIQINADGC